jgi:two-component system, LuxR family, response regulator FixJ
MESEPVIHVVDDDAAMRDSLSFLLGSANYSVRLYSDARLLLAHLDGLEPGVVVTDVRMPGLSGLELARAIKAHGAPHPIIVLTGHADVALAVEAMKSGAFDFLEKPFDDEALLSALRQALAQGEQAAAREAVRAEYDARIASLTPRERDVFEAVVEGESNKEAAARLGISPRTVEIYRANVMAKMKAKSLSDLVRMALAQR